MTRAELPRLIELVVEEVSAAATGPRSRCTCHAVTSDCCPDRLQGVLEAGATRVGVHAAGDTMELGLTDEVGPGVLHGSQDPTYTYVLMPMRL